MRLAFTICSNNYLAQASVLAESFKRFNNDFYFAIILLDKISDLVDYTIIKADEVIPIDSIEDYGLEKLYDKYNIIELNTAVKPFIFKYLIGKFTQVELLYYFDPDLKFFSGVDVINQQLSTSSIVITPHISSPIPMDGLQPQEQLFLNYGLYNLGFIGLNPRHNESIRILDWWGERTFNIGYDDTSNGLFVDQLWMNFAPLFFSNVTVSHNFGLNMGPWNLHERKIKVIDDDIIVLTNDDILVFYHFSSYNYLKPESISKHYDRYTFEMVGNLSILYNSYHNDLLRLGIEKYTVIPYAYGKRAVQPTQTSIGVKQRIKNKLKSIFFS